GIFGHLVLCPIVILTHAAFVACWDRITLGNRIDVGWLEIVRRHLAGSALYEVLGYVLFATLVEASVRRRADSDAPFIHLPSAQETGLVIRSANSISHVRLGDVHFLEASGNYVRVHTAERTLSLRGSLSSVQQKLDARFTQVHRSRVVNREQVAGLHSLGRHR